MLAVKAVLYDNSTDKKLKEGLAIIYGETSLYIFPAEIDDALHVFSQKESCISLSEGAPPNTYIILEDSLEEPPK